MSKSEIEKQDEINLMEIFILISKNKWKFFSILLISCLLALTLILYQNKVYKFSTIIKPARPSVFYDYMYVNRLLDNNIFNIDMENLKITNISILIKLLMNLMIMMK